MSITVQNVKESDATEPHQFSAEQLSALYRSGKLSPVEATKSVLAHIDKYEPQLNAFALLTQEAALDAARASEGRWQAGQPLGELDGVPVAVKDNLWVKGWPTLYGSKAADPDQLWENDCAAAARLREQGAVFLGKTTTSEFASRTLADSPLTGITRNPWNPRHSPGGSSGGSAAAAAIGFGPLHVATDGGGSTRVPSSYSGLFGFKPSYGRVPSWPSSHTAATFHVTPMTRTVGDSARLLNVITRPDCRDFNALPHDPRDWRDQLEAGIKGLRIGFSADLGYIKVDPQVAQCVREAVKVFESLGAVVEAVDPSFTDPLPIFKTLSIAAAAHLLTQLPVERHALLGTSLQRSGEAGRALGALDYVKAVRERENLARTMARFHQKWDLLLTPATPITAPLADYPADDPGPTTLSPFVFPFNLTRQPAASVPVGFTSAGLPVGLQIVGPHLRDHLVLRAARAYEQQHPFVTTSKVL